MTFSNHDAPSNVEPIYTFATRFRIGQIVFARIGNSRIEGQITGITFRRADDVYYSIQYLDMSGVVREDLISETQVAL